MTGPTRAEVLATPPRDADAEIRALLQGAEDCQPEWQPRPTRTTTLPSIDDYQENPVSIYASIEGIGHDGDPAIGPPWRYRGSHILPAEDDPRGGSIDLALIPSHITRDCRDDAPEDGAPWPWLRLSVDDSGDSAVLLDPRQARHLARQLTDWADDAEAKEPTP